jgi:hypothetical protein
MKTKAKTLGGIALLTTLLTASTAFATSTPAATPAPPDRFMSSLPPDGSALDYSRKDAVSALINYEAASRMQDYQLNQQLLFMQAPGSVFSIQAGAMVGATNSAGFALGMSYASFALSMNGLSQASNLKINGNPVAGTTGVSVPVGPLEMYQQIGNFVKSGDLSNLAIVNIAPLLQTDNLADPKSGISQSQALTLVNMIADPFPSVDPTILSKIKSNTPLTGADMEAVGSRVASYAIVGVSATALTDIIARRVPGSNQTQSVMQIMDNQSQERFTNIQWYNSIGAASEAALLREIAHMMAYNQWVSYEQFRVSEQQLALLASINSVMARVNVSMQQMTSQMAAGQAQASAAQQQVQQKLNTQNSNQLQLNQSPIPTSP